MQQIILVSEQVTESSILSGNLQSGSILLGNRIPKDFFITNGIGESDITVHAGSYHLALKDAGIECYNILTYSSILPAIATQVEKPARYVHGSVAETIMAAASSTQGILATAGIIFGWLYDKVTGQKYGGLVCEYNGSEREEEAGNSLRASLKELYVHGFSEGYDLGEIQLLTRSFIPRKKFGTALVALVFTNYVVPVEG
jgi:arginine decarboxylase